MKFPKTLAMVAALAAPAVVAAQPAPAIAVNCGAPTAAAESEPLNLHGTWDFVMDVGGTPNFGLLSIGLVGSDYGGSLSLWSTAPVVLRELTVTGLSFHMAVASRDGDVLFDGVISTRGDRMCGTVTYHEGRKFPAVAQKRPTGYRPQQPARP